MSQDLLVDITVFVLSLLVGFEVISKVPATLHTPLMSGANSIHGIVLIGAMLICATVQGAVGYLIAFAAMAFAAMNVVGGYTVTDRMLQMFRARPASPGVGAAERAALGDGARGRTRTGDGDGARDRVAAGDVAPDRAGSGDAAREPAGAAGAHPDERAGG